MHRKKRHWKETTQETTRIVDTSIVLKLKQKIKIITVDSKVV